MMPENPWLAVLYLTLGGGGGVSVYKFLPVAWRWWWRYWRQSISDEQNRTKVEDKRAGEYLAELMRARDRLQERVDRYDRQREKSLEHLQHRYEAALVENLEHKAESVELKKTILKLSDENERLRTELAEWKQQSDR